MIAKVFNPIFYNDYNDYNQCFGSRSGRIHIIWPDPDPYQNVDLDPGTKNKIVINSHTNQPKL